MFLQLENNTPEVYSEKSRDFQLICRIMNIFLNALIEESNKIVYNTDVDNLDEDLLYLTVRKQGFVTRKYFPANVLRNICENYPYLIKKKGTLSVIKDAAYTILSANREIYYLEVGPSDIEGSDPLTINISSNAGDDYNDYLKELLSFLVPAGVIWNFIPNVTIETTYKINIELDDLIQRFRGFTSAISRIIGGIDKRLAGTGVDAGKLTSRGVDWEQLGADGNYYKVDWNGYLKETSNNTLYSKVNVAKIVVSSDDNRKIAVDTRSGNIKPENQ